MHATTKMANLAENRQRAGENLNEITRGAPCKVEKLTNGISDRNGESDENGESHIIARGLRGAILANIYSIFDENGKCAEPNIYQRLNNILTKSSLFPLQWIPKGKRRSMRLPKVLKPEYFILGKK